MDRKSIILLIVCFVVLVLWYPLVNKLYPPKPLPQSTNTLAASTNQVPGLTSAPPSLSVATGTTAAAMQPAPVTPATPTAKLKFPEDVPEQTVVVTNALARYVFTSHGGGLKFVELTQYPEKVGRQANRKKSSPPQFASLNKLAPLPVMTLLGDPALEDDAVYKLTPLTGGVRAEKVLSNRLAVVKEFFVSSNYLLQVQVRLENRGDKPLMLPPHQWIVGTATPLTPEDNERFVGFYWFNGARAIHETDAWFANRTLGCFPGTPRWRYMAGLNDVAWAAVHNQFFALALVAPTNLPASHIIVDKVWLPGPSPEQLAEHPRANRKPFGLQAMVTYPELTLEPGQAIQRPFHIFAGPREYRTLAKLGVQLGTELDTIMGYGGFFGFFAKLLLVSMNGLHSLGLSYAMSIIAITVIIKLLFWPLTQASTRSMKRMQELQPQMKAIQEKYKDDPAKMQRKMMEFMKEHKVNPMGGCLPMLLQFPVFIGFYQMIQSAIELRGERFLWAYDLSQPDTIFVIPGVNFPVNPLPLIMGATMLWQSRMTPVSPGVDPMQQKLMRYMPLMFLFILYNFSSGLTLYWTVQNLLTIAQMKLIRSRDESGATAQAAPPKPKAVALPPKKKKKKTK